MADKVTYTILIPKAHGPTLFRGLEEWEARAIMQHLMPGLNPWSDTAIEYRVGCLVEGSVPDLKKASPRLGVDPASLPTCFASDGSTLEAWPKPDDYEERWAKAKERMDMCMRVNAALEAKERERWTSARS